MRQQTDSPRIDEPDTPGAWPPTDRPSRSISLDRPNNRTRASFSTEKLHRIICLIVIGLLTLAACIMTTIAVTAGTWGEVSPELAIVSIDMGNFARFRPIEIHLVKEDTGQKMLRGLDLDQIINNPSDALEDFEDDAQNKTEDLRDKASELAEDVTNKVDDVIEEVGDKISDLKGVVEEVFKKVLKEVETGLNEWIRNVADALGDLDIAQRYSLHAGAFCHVPRNSTLNTNATSNASIPQAICTSAFNSNKDDEFNKTQNAGRILGFSPGHFVGGVLDLFLLPAEVQKPITAPINSASDTVQGLMHDAKNTVVDLALKFVFSPMLFPYAVACGFSWILFCFILADIARCFFFGKGEDQDLALRTRTKILYLVLPVAAVFFLLIGAIVTTVIALIARVVGVAADVVSISVEPGSQFTALTWASVVILIIVAVGLIVVNSKLMSRIAGKSKHSGGKSRGEPKGFELSSFETHSQ